MKKQEGGGGSNRSTLVGKWDEVAVDSLRPAARRTRSHSGYKRKMLETSILKDGIIDPLTVSAAGVIVDGHLRWEVAKKLGLRTVPVISVAHLSCGSACKKDPVSGVIGVQKGPLISIV